MTSTADLYGVDAAEAATLAEWAEHWRRWVEEHGREPHTRLDADAEACVLFDTPAFGGGVRPLRTIATLNETAAGVFTEAGVVVKPRPGPYSGSLFVYKPNGPFKLVALSPGSPVAALRTFAIWWVYATPNPIERHHELAAAVVAAKSPDLDPGRATTAKRALAASIADTVRGWGPGLGWDWAGLSKLPRLDGATVIPDTVDIGGLDIGASLDVAAGFLAAIGPEGKRAAAAYSGKTDPGLWVRPSGPKTAPDGPTRSPLLWSLAVALWADVVGPKLDRERERARASRPVVARVFAIDEMIPAMAYGAQRALPGILPDGHELKDRKGNIVARIVGDVETTLRGLEKIGSPVGQRLINSIVYRAWEQYEANSQDAGVVEYEGGWAGVARALDYDEKDTGTLRALAVAGQSVRWDSGLAYGGGWWTWSATRGWPGKPGVVRFRPADPLRPAYITALEQADRAHTPSSRERRRPIPLLAYGPPVGSLNERSHGAVWLLSRWFVVELVDRAAELHLDGGIRLDERQWRDLADRAGLSLANLSKLRDAWFAGDDPSKAPPLIKNVDGGRVTLSDAHELSRIFIEERGMLVAEGRKSGRRSAEAKRNMAQKKAPRPRGKA